LQVRAPDGVLACPDDTFNQPGAVGVEVREAVQRDDDGPFLRRQAQGLLDQSVKGLGVINGPRALRRQHGLIRPDPGC
jgi:hypothetical protein